MKFTRGLDPKESMKIGLSGIKDCLPDLMRVFPRLKSSEIDEIIKRFNSAESYWDVNRTRIKNIEKPIKYLLFCEAPPESGKYFYKSTDDYLFKQVWKCFFGNKPICSNPDDAYQCLANIGFLLIDSLPFPVKYKSRHRRKPAYLDIIKCYLPTWVNTIDVNFTFDPDLRIAFGFKLNGIAVVNASPKGIVLSGINRTLNIDMIAATGAGQPSSSLLAQKFGVAWGSHKCSKC